MVRPPLSLPILLTGVFFLGQKSWRFVNHVDLLKEQVLISLIFLSWFSFLHLFIYFPLILIISLLLLDLDLVSLSFSIVLKFFENFFLNRSMSSCKFPSKHSLASFHKFCYLVFLFLLISKYFLRKTLIYKYAGLLYSLQHSLQ